MTEWKSDLRRASVALAATIVIAPLAACVPPQSSRSHDHAVRTRTLAWPAGDRLHVGTSADVRYVQGPDAKAIITGPADEIDDIVVDDGWIRHEGSRWRWRLWNWDWRERGVHIVVTAPQVNDAGIGGSGHLDLGRLTQDHLQLSVSGSGSADVSGQFKSLELSVSGSGGGRLGQVTVGDMTAHLSGSGGIRAAGAAETLHLGVSGSGGADLSDLTVQDADAHLSGSGWARLSPKRSADIAVSGSGSVRLLSEPPRLVTHRGGSGSIVLPNRSRS